MYSQHIYLPSVMNNKQITQKHAKTFYFASLFLSLEKRKATYNVYAICRLCDDAVDKSSKKTAKQRLKLLNAIISDIYNNKNNFKEKSLTFKEFQKTVEKYTIPKTYFEELIQGVEMDLIKRRYGNFIELYDYCFKVAGVIGLMMLKIFQTEDDKAKSCAVKLGIAMQLTNILRDIKEDYQMGRIYLPQDEMKKFKITEAQIKKQIVNNNFKKFIDFQIKRAKCFYKEADAGISLIPDKNSRLVIKIMRELYAGILDAIKKNNCDVFSRRAHVPLSRKILRTLIILTKGIKNEN